MTDDSLPLAEMAAETSYTRLLRAAAEVVVPLIIEAGLEGQISPARHKPSAGSDNHRNCFRNRTICTPLGSLALRIRKPRQGSYFQPFLKPRQTAEKGAVPVIQEAWTGGVSNRWVDVLIHATGLSGISNSHPSTREPWPPQKSAPF